MLLNFFYLLLVRKIPRLVGDFFIWLKIFLFVLCFAKCLYEKNKKF